MNLKDYIRNVPDFPKAGIQFKDITPLLNNAEAFIFTIKALAGLYDHKSIDKVAGLESRGLILGAVVAYEMNLPFVPVRKSGKLPHNTIQENYGLEYGKDCIEIHIDSIKPRENVLIIDDLLAAGGSMRAAADLVKRLEGNIIGCSVLIELDELRGRDRLKEHDVKSLLRY